MSDIYYVVAHRSQQEIDSFKTRYEEFNPSCIYDIVNHDLNLQVKKIMRSTTWGSSHVIYFVTVKHKNKPLVFRANLGFNIKPEIVMKTEQLICEKAKKMKVPTNTILHVDISRKKYPFDYQIQECLDGSDIENNFQGTKDEYDKLSFDLGVYIATYSQIQFEKFGMFDEVAVYKNSLRGSKNTFFDYITTCLRQDIAFLTKNRVVSALTGIRILKLFEEYKPVINSVKKGSLVHHDLADHNIFFKVNKISGIFDWEAAVSGDPVLDISSCPTWKTFYPREEKLIAGYASITGLPEYFREKMNIYRLRTMLWKTVYAMRMNILNESRKQKFMDSLKPFKLGL